MTHHKKNESQVFDICLELSIIIPAKNEAAFIGPCIEYVKKSIEFWGKQAEIIVVDNGSIDQTVEIAMAKGAQVIIDNKGTIGHLRNTGAKCARGHILAFLDADCLVDPKWISYCLEKMENLNVAGVGTRAIPDMNNATWVEKTIYLLMAGSERPDYVNWLGTSNIFFRKKLFWDVHGFDEAMVTGEDVNLCNKLNRSYLLCLEKRINTLHLRESKSLFELFRRELWRGQNSFESFVKGGCDLHELPSVAVPLLNIITLLLFFVFMAFTSKLAIFFFVIGMALPLMFVLKKLNKVSFSKHFFTAYIISFVYLFARSVAVGFEIIRFITSDKSEKNEIYN